jgi:cobalamin biosynthesis Co2+ chelatase CbiK
LLSKEHEELKLKIETIKNKTNESLEIEQSILCAIPIFKVDASTSCIDLIDESYSNHCNEKCYENVVIESCDDLTIKENDELKQEVERLMRDFARLKGKSIVQPSQVNRENMVKKLEKGETVTCFKCHHEGHKSYKCPQPKKMISDEKNKKSFTIKNFLIYTKPN